VIQFVEITAGGIGRDAMELLRKIKAAQYVAAHPGEVCPAKWEEGEKTLKPRRSTWSARSKALRLVRGPFRSRRRRRSLRQPPEPAATPTFPEIFRARFLTPGAARLAVGARHVGRWSEDPAESLSAEPAPADRRWSPRWARARAPRTCWRCWKSVAGTSDKVSLNLAGDDARKPSFAITRAVGDA
jgi:hypothetical protein